MRRARTFLPWIAFCVVLIVAPDVFSSAHSRLVLILALIYASLAVSWNLTLGLAGIFNFAQVAFFGIGAYATAVMCTKTDVSPWIAVGVSGLSAAIAATVAFLPVLRLRGIYIALATYIFTEVCVYAVLADSGLTGGSNGIVNLPDLSIGSLNFYNNNQIGYYYFGAVLLFVVALLFTILTRSRFGLSLIALRGNEALATSRGIRRARQQYLAFVVGAVFAGFAGSYDALFNGTVSTDVFSFNYLTLLLCMIFLGGRRSIPGAIVGALIIEILDNKLSQVGAWQNVVTSGVIIIVLWVFPDGLAGLAQAAVRRIRGYAGNVSSRKPDVAPMQGNVDP